MKIFKVIYFIIICFIMGCYCQVRAQQEPQYTQYMFNVLSVNPAYAGTRETLNMLLLSRIQWVGVEGAPKSHTFTAHTPVKDSRIGLGFSVVSDRVGPVRNTYINLNYSHRFSLRDKLTLAMGLKGGIGNFNIDLVGSELTEDIPDPSFSYDIRKVFQPNFGTGFYLYSEKLYFGFSVPKLMKTDLDEVNANDGVISKLNRHYYTIAGYVFDINEDLKIKPSLLNKLVEGAPPSTDITVQSVYKEIYWLGATYRIGDAIAALINLQITPELMVGYSYDITISGLSNVTNGSHEIMISYDFTRYNNNKMKSSKYF